MRKVKQEDLKHHHARHIWDLGRAVNAAYESPTSQEKSGHGKECRIWEQKPLGTLSPLQPIFQPSDCRNSVSVQWGKKSKNMCHVDRTISWLTFSFFNLFLCHQTQHQGTVLAAFRTFDIFSSLPQTDSSSAKRNTQSVTIDSNDCAIYILIWNKSYDNSLKYYLCWNILTFCFPFNFTFVLWF